MASLIDWDVAVATAGRLLRPGPAASAEQAAAVVADLRRLAVEAETHVRRFTGLAADEQPPPAAVVDRPTWVANNVDGFRAVVGPLLDQLTRGRAAQRNPVVTAVGSRLTGAQLGTVLAFLAGKVLGQYEVFLPEGQGEGRLSLVAPNIVAAERALDADPHDFRLWVCLHESTHRTQFTAVPWLREHLLAEIAAYVDATDLDPAALADRLRQATGALAAGLRRRGDVSLLELVQTPAQRAVLDRLTALMTLVEGHAEFVMDGVGPAVVPSVEQIRQAFDARREGTGPLDRLLRRLLGLDLKMKQYAEGRRFVAAVVDAVGMAGFNRVWESPATLPTTAEVAEPAAWVRRVHPAPDRPAATASA